jgi:protein disulfide-isomerase
MKRSITSALSAAVLACTAFAVHAESAESLESILQQARSANKPILLEFTGSDWCPPCKMMQKEVFSTDAFKKFADSDILFVKLDFPKSREQADEVKTRNRSLAEKYNIEGFPTLVVLSPQGEELSRQVGFMRGGPDAVIDWIKSSSKM